MTNGQTRQEFNEGYTNMLGALPTGVEAERKITFQKQSSAAPSFTLPYLVSIPKPVHYPKSAIRQGWEGEVVTALEILPDGSVGRSGLAESSGYDVLDQTALREAKTWQFSPALKNGKPITEYIQIPIKFKLQSD
jgi:protein TonB